MGRFGGVKASHGKIACKISHNLLVPYFDYSADEIRKIGKSDRKRAEKFFDDGGKRVVNDFTSLASLKMKLLHSCEDFFRKKRDNNNLVEDNVPILIITHRN